MPRIFVPGPQPRTRREQAALAASFVVRCAAAGVAGAGLAALLVVTAAALTIGSDIAVATLVEARP